MISHALTVAAFCAVLVGVLALDHLGRRDGSRIPTLSELCAFVMRWRPGRVVVLFFWWWLGWHFLAR
jgi:Family of unknown function (DUF6186)